MPRFLRVSLAVIAGLIVGSAVNMGLLMLGGRLVAPPAGADVSTMEGLKAALPLFEPRHFVSPFLAHALGTLAGALAAALLAPRRPALAAGVVGGVFLLGGIANVLMLPGPAWFAALDLLLAYLPMAWVGWKLAARSRHGQAA
jgi:hypothetical protein